MFERRAFMFGYSKEYVFLAKELRYNLMNLSIIVNEEIAYKKAIDDGYSNVKLLDVTDDTALEELPIKENDYLICVMKDHYLNVFLTLSLHNIFPKAIIVALSDSPHTTQKLKMAGASRIIDIYQVSANRIYNILHKPLTTKLVERLLSTDEDFSFREMVIPQGSLLDGIMVDDFDFTKHGIILVGMIDRRLSNQFIFITSGLENRLDVEDTIVCIGYNADLEKFEEYMKLSGD